MAFPRSLVGCLVTAGAELKPFFHRVLLGVLSRPTWRCTTYCGGGSSRCTPCRTHSGQSRIPNATTRLHRPKAALCLTPSARLLRKAWNSTLLGYQILRCLLSYLSEENHRPGHPRRLKSPRRVLQHLQLGGHSHHQVAPGVTHPLLRGGVVSAQAIFFGGHPVRCDNNHEEFAVRKGPVDEGGREGGASERAGKIMGKGGRPWVGRGEAFGRSSGFLRVCGQVSVGR